MTSYRFLTSAAWGSLASALLLSTLPVQAQERGDRGFRGIDNTERPMRESGPRQGGGWAGGEARSSGGGDSGPGVTARQERQGSQAGGYRGNWGGGMRNDWGGGMRGRWEGPAGRNENRPPPAEASGGGTAQSYGAYGADRNTTYSAPRDGSYGATTRSRDWAAEGQTRGPAAHGQQQQGAVTGWSRWGDRRDDRRDGNHYGQNSGGWDSRGWRDGNRYGQNSRGWDNRGWRDGNRYGGNNWAQNDRRWDSRGWRSDDRYDWYRYRSNNRSLFSLGRYYAPYRGHSYSRIGIGIRLGSPFYSNRYWINDPWRYRLPDAYGSYRWIRYYSDALLVDIYSGEVVDVIPNFFW